MFKKSVPLLHKIQRISITNTQCSIMLVMKILAIYCENHMKHINTLCWENARLRNVTTGGTHTQ
jgi:hypothetical protein